MIIAEVEKILCNGLT